MRYGLSIGWMVGALLVGGCVGGTDDETTDKIDAPTDADAGDADADADADSDADSDADADSDSDADADSDADSDPEPTCADAGTPPITEAEFLSTFSDKYCWVWNSGCSVGTCPGAPPPPIGCVFDPIAACACLDASWRCTAGLPASPLSCQQAYDCGGTTETGFVRDSGGSSGVGGSAAGSGFPYGSGYPTGSGVVTTPSGSDDPTTTTTTGGGSAL